MKKIKIRQAFWLICISLFIVSCSKTDEATEDALGVPSAYSAVNLTNSGFTANWTRVYQAEKYLLDVSTSAGFTTLLPNYSALPVSGLTVDVSGLNSGTIYYYRVRAVKGSQISAFSNVITVEIISTGPEPTTALKAAANFNVGMIVRSSGLTGQTSDIILREFDNITSEYEMKMDKMYPSKGTYDFVAVDKIVKYATDNNLNLHGHALIWHNSVPSWVTNFAGTNAEFEAMVKEYITTVVTRYKGKIKSWDVVNEAIDDGSGNPLRNSVFKQKMGAILR